jgi:hypothetical protein
MVSVRAVCTRDCRATRLIYSAQSSLGSVRSLRSTIVLFAAEWYLFLPHISLGTASGQFLRPVASRLLLSRFLPNGKILPAVPAENLHLDRLLLSRLSRFASMNAKTMRP